MDPSTALANRRIWLQIIAIAATRMVIDNGLWTVRQLTGIARVRLFFPGTYAKPN